MKKSTIYTLSILAILCCTALVEYIITSSAFTAEQKVKVNQVNQVNRTLDTLSPGDLVNIGEGKYSSTWEVQTWNDHIITVKGPMPDSTATNMIQFNTKNIILRLDALDVTSITRSTDPGWHELYAWCKMN